ARKDSERSPGVLTSTRTFVISSIAKAILATPRSPKPWPGSISKSRSLSSVSSPCKAEPNTRGFRPLWDSTNSNQVWNYCVAQQIDTQRRYRAGAKPRKWASNFDLQKLCKGAGAELHLHQQSV